MGKSQSVYCFLLVILCCVHLNRSLRLTNAATGADPLTITNTTTANAGSSSTTATTTSSPVIHSQESVNHKSNSSSSGTDGHDNNSINLVEEETKTQQGSKITISNQKTTGPAAAAATVTASESRRKILLPVSSGAANLLAYPSVESNTRTVKSNEVEATTDGNSSITSRTEQLQEQEEEVKAETEKERKGWPSIRNCNYTYQSDVDVVYVSCLNHESGNGKKEEKTEMRQEEGDMNPRSRDLLNQLSSPAEPPHIFTPDLSVPTLPSSSYSVSSIDSKTSAPLSQSEDAADATKTSSSSSSTTASASRATTRTATTTTLLTVDLLISGFQISSLNQSVFDIVSIDLLNNRTGKGYAGANIRSLILSNNSISRIRGDCCLFNMSGYAAAAHGSLQHLDLSHNLIRELKAETFDGLQSILSSLILSHNLLQSIEFLSSKTSSAVNGSSSSSRLTYLDLCHNRLRVLHESSLWMHPLLEYINLSGNMINSIDAGSFVSLRHLSHLDLSSNPLVTNEDDKLILTSLSRSLQVINLSNTSHINSNKNINKSSSNAIPAGIDPFVRELILSHNQLSQISLGDFESDADHSILQTLDLSHNQIREIEDDALGRLSSLRELRLNQNLLSVIPQRLPSSNLMILMLDQNSITSLPDSCVSSLTRMQSLHLAGNQITNLHPDALRGMTELKQLNLSSNSISILSYSMFHHCMSLQLLDISHNPIMQLSSYTFSGLNSLTHLILSHVVANESMIKIDSGTLTPLIRLQKLDLSHGPGLLRALLHYDPQDVDSLNPLSFLPSVEQINLDFNEIQELEPVDSDALKYWLQSRQGILKSISLRESEWKCDHSIQWLIKWIKSLLLSGSSFASPASSVTHNPFSSSCCSYASPSHQNTSSSSQPPPPLLMLIPLSSVRETMASDATNSSSGNSSRITLVSKEPLMQLTSLPPSTFIPASASLASASDPAAVTASAAVTETTSSSGGSNSDENEIPPSSASGATSSSSPSSFRLDHVTDIICSSPEDLRGRSVISLTEEELMLQPAALIQMHSMPGEAEAKEKKTTGKDGVGENGSSKIERGMRMDQNSEAAHPSSSVSTSEQGITAYSRTTEASKSPSPAAVEAAERTSTSPSSLSSPPPSSPPPLLVVVS